MSDGGYKSQSPSIATISQHVTAVPVSSSKPEYVSLEEAAHMKGVRITMVQPGMTGIYPEALKNICYVKQIPFTRVIHPQMGQGDNQEYLYKLTAQKSSPVMFYENERPRSSWLEQLALAEQIGKGPCLVPKEIEHRTLMYGLLNEVLGYDGFLWNKRHLCAQQFGNDGDNPFGQKYGTSKSTISEAPAKVIYILKYFNGILEKQQAVGSKFLIGKDLTALDIYWATSVYIVALPDEDILPRSFLLDLFMKANTPEIEAAVTQLIKEHRDFIIKTYCECPVVN